MLGCLPRTVVHTKADQFISLDIDEAKQQMYKENYIFGSFVHTQPIFIVLKDRTMLFSFFFFLTYTISFIQGV